MSGVGSMIPKIFLGGALFGAIGCLSRADYNLPIFLFAYIAWNYLRVPHSFLKFSQWFNEISPYFPNSPYLNFFVLS